MQEVRLATSIAGCSGLAGHHCQAQGIAGTDNERLQGLSVECQYCITESKIVDLHIPVPAHAQSWVVNVEKARKYSIDIMEKVVWFGTWKSDSLHERERTLLVPSGQFRNMLVSISSWIEVHSVDKLATVCTVRRSRMPC